MLEVLGIRLHRIWVYSLGSLRFWLFRFQADLFSRCFLTDPIRFYSKESLRREVLALPNWITSKIFGPSLDARARLELLHWIAAVRLSASLLTIVLLPSAHHRRSAAKSLCRLLHAPLLPQWRARWNVSRYLQ